MLFLFSHLREYNRNILSSIKMRNIRDFQKIYGKQTTNFDLNEIAKQLGIKNFHILMSNELLLIKDVRNTNSTNTMQQCNV